MNQYFNNATFRLAIASMAFILFLVIVYYIYKYVYTFLRKRASLTPGKIDDFILSQLKVPALWFIYWFFFNLFIHIFLAKFQFFSVLLHINTLLFIFSIGWISIKTVSASAYYLQTKLKIDISDNLNARRRLTQLNVFKGIANSIIIIIAIAIGLMTFEQARTIGVSLLTSAGIIGIIVGFAAQKSIGMLLAGIQIAITQPISLDDVVVVEGEWGRIEEITLTYVVVKIWDERRLILPVSWFLEKPFQNWTRKSGDIIGTLFLYLDYSFPIDAIRDVLPEMLNKNNDWDNRVCNVQVTNTTERYKEVRVLLSSSDSSKNWDLRVAIREKLIDFIHHNYPEAFSKIRLKIMDHKELEKE